MEDDNEKDIRLGIDDDVFGKPESGGRGLLALT